MNCFAPLKIHIRFSRGMVSDFPTYATWKSLLLSPITFRTVLTLTRTPETTTTKYINYIFYLLGSIGADCVFVYVCVCVCVCVCVNESSQQW
jgi:hypothetical protein